MGNDDPFELDDETRAGIAAGVADLKAGNVRPWQEIAEELGLTSTGNELEGLVAEIAHLKQILAELRANNGIDQLEKLIEKRNGELKSRMIAGQREFVTDEVSGYRARLQVSTRTIYDLGLLRKLFTTTQRKRYIVTTVDEQALKAGLKNGDISENTLVGSGAMGREPYQLSLYVEPFLKEAADV